MNLSELEGKLFGILDPYIDAFDIFDYYRLVNDTLKQNPLMKGELEQYYLKKAAEAVKKRGYSESLNLPVFVDRQHVRIVKYFIKRKKLGEEDEAGAAGGERSRSPSSQEDDGMEGSGNAAEKARHMGLNEFEWELYKILEPYVEQISFMRYCKDIKDSMRRYPEHIETVRDWYIQAVKDSFHRRKKPGEKKYNIYLPIYHGDDEPAYYGYQKKWFAPRGEFDEADVGAAARRRGEWPRGERGRESPNHEDEDMEGKGEGQHDSFQNKHSTWRLTGSPALQQQFNLAQMSGQGYYKIATHRLIHSLKTGDEQTATGLIKQIYKHYGVKGLRNLKKIVPKHLQ